MVSSNEWIIAGIIIVGFIAFMIFRRMGKGKDKGPERIDPAKETRARYERLLYWFHDKDNYVKFLNQGTKRLGKIKKIMPVCFDGEAMKEKKLDTLYLRLMQLRVPAKPSSKKDDKNKPANPMIKEITELLAEEKKPLTDKIDPIKEPDRVKELYLMKVRKPRFFFPLGVIFGKTLLYLIPKSVLEIKSNALVLSYNVSFDEVQGIMVCDETSKWYLKNTHNILMVESLLQELPNFTKRAIYIEEKIAATTALEEKKQEMKDRGYQAETERGSKA